MKNFIGSRAIPEVNYFSPKNLNDALNHLDNFEGNLKILAGGTDIIPAIRAAKLVLSDNINILDIKSIENLNHITFDKKMLRIGAITTLSEIVESDIVRKNFSLLSDAINQIGSLQIRNWATIGGNLCNASPAADAAVPLLALDASLRLQSKEEDRVVPVSKFFIGPGKTALKPNELLTEILIPIQKGISVFIKLGRRNTFTLSVISVAVFVQINENIVNYISIALGAVAPIPLRAKNKERILIGKELKKENIEEAVRTIKEEVSPISDVRASSEYRKDMSGVLLRRALKEILKN